MKAKDKKTSFRFHFSNANNSPSSTMERKVWSEDIHSKNLSQTRHCKNETTMNREKVSKRPLLAMFALSINPLDEQFKTQLHDRSGDQRERPSGILE
jgi:hypothetical protein